MTRITIIDGHPDPDPVRYCHALAGSYAAGAEAAGHSVRMIRLADVRFELLRSEADYRNEPPPPAIAEAQESLRWAQHLVVIYPLWLGDVPALLKGFLEQLLRPDFAFGYPEHGFPTGKLKGRSARVIVTMGMPAPIYTLLYRAHSLKSLERNILGLCGFAPVRHTILGMIAGKQAPRERWLEQVRALGAAAR